MANLAPNRRVTPDDLLAQLNSLAERASLHTLLRDIRCDQHLLSVVAARSYAHENGFAKLVLCQSGGLKLRLHVWQPGLSARAQENIHDHRWHFASHIICGEIRNDIFELGGNHSGESAESCLAYQYARPAAGLGYQLRDLGYQILGRTQTRRFAAGVSYALDRSVFHRIVHEYEGLTATLVLTGVPESPDCHLFARAPQPTVGADRERTLTPDQVGDLFDHVLEAA